MIAAEVGNNAIPFAAIRYLCLLIKERIQLHPWYLCSLVKHSGFVHNVGLGLTSGFVSYTLDS